MKTTRELKQLALDITNGLVFSDRHLSEIQIADGVIKKIFTPLLLGMNGYTPEQVESGEIAMIYEYLDKSVRPNGELPSFMSFHTLNQNEVSKLSRYIEHYETMKQGYIEFDNNFINEPDED